MRYTISGTVMQTVAIDLAPGETVYSQTNCMCWMNDAVVMDTHTGGGLMAGIMRSMSGGSLFVTSFAPGGQASGHIAFASKFPGSIMPVVLKNGESLICRTETFLCAEQSVTLEVALPEAGSEAAADLAKRLEGWHDSRDLRARFGV